MSCGLPRFVWSCGLAGLMPGARPVVPASAGEGGFAAGGVDVPVGLVGPVVERARFRRRCCRLRRRTAAELCASARPPERARIAAKVRQDVS